MVGSCRTILGGARFWVLTQPESSNNKKLILVMEPMKVEKDLERFFVEWFSMSIRNTFETLFHRGGV